MKPNRFGQVVVPIAIVFVVVMMVVPLPTVVLDLLLAVNITCAVLILLVSMYVLRPLEFSIFPSLLLVMTMFRLALNVSATRLVLLHGYAGKVIESFGHFVVGGSLVVGLVIFFILIVIQFMVITNGAGRVAEVAARFTLDAMPGKQMAIDADLNAGLIDERTARKRRETIAAEADFYGAMDGASKFVKGDAIAAIVITTINLLGGFVVGMFQKHMQLNEAISTYSLLSVGDGLVSQIPALLISISTGLIVTRAATDADLGTDIISQFSVHRRGVRVAASVAAAIALVPGLPRFPFLMVSGVMFLVSTRLQDRPPVAVDAAGDDGGPAELPPPAPDSPEAIMGEMRVEPLQLEVSYDLIDLVDPGRGGDLLDRVKALRRKLALELGIVIPLVRTRDNVNLPAHTYALRVHGVELARGEAPAGSVLVIGDDLGSLPGTPTREPVFGLAAKWVPVELRQQAELRGCTVVDRASVVTTHLAEVVRSNAGRLLSRQDVKMLLDMLRTADPVVVDELNAVQIGMGEVQAVLRNLLDERVAIRDLVRITEAISEKGRTAKDVESLTEAARLALGPAISADLASDGRLTVLTLEPLLEHSLFEALRANDTGSFVAIDPEKAEALITDVVTQLNAAEQRGEQPALVCAMQLRPALHRLLKAAAPRLAVLSYAELGPQLQVDSIGVIHAAVGATV